MDYRLHHGFKFDWSIFLNLKPISYSFGIHNMAYQSSLDHDLIASILEKAISNLVGNLNLSCTYLITAVSQTVCDKQDSGS